jgi:FkbM family methyltransferase
VFSELGHAAATQKVDVCRLDEVFDEVTSQVRDPRVLLKIDTQGSDLRVLEGAMGVLDRVHALQVEVPAEAHLRRDGVPCRSCSGSWASSARS